MILDTGAVINGFTADSHYHEECLEALDSAEIRVLSPVSLCEIDYVMTSRFGVRAAAKLLTRLAEPDFEVAPFGAADLDAAVDVIRQYEDLNVGLTDASLVVLAKRYKTDEILTLDQRHFRAMRSLSGRPFKLLPFDAD